MSRSAASFALGGTGTSTRYTGGTLRINETMSTLRGITFKKNRLHVIYSGGIDVGCDQDLHSRWASSRKVPNSITGSRQAKVLLATAANTFRQAAFTDGTYQFGTEHPLGQQHRDGRRQHHPATGSVAPIAADTGANIALAKNASTTTYNYGGGMNLQMESGTGFSVEFAADNLLRRNQGTLVLQTTGSTTLGAAGATNAARLIPTNLGNTASSAPPPW